MATLRRRGAKRNTSPWRIQRRRSIASPSITWSWCQSQKTKANPARTPYKRVHQETFSHISPVDIAWADYDNDGWPDLLVSYVSGALQLFHNDHGQFVDVTPTSGLMEFRHRITAASWGDYDGDGLPDLYIGYAYAPASFNRLYHNDGGGTLHRGQ